MQFHSHKEEILEIAAQKRISIRKKQGQCFLINEQIVNFIVENASLHSDTDCVLEIGPGFGVLTEKLIELSKKVCAIELDRKLCSYLQIKFSDRENFTLRNDDALKIEFPAHSKLISNVPYHISGPLIQKIVISEKKAELIILMLQEEFIDRMKVPPQAKGYGRISVISQLFFEIEVLRKVSRFDFYPQPEVESGIISLKFKPEFIDNPHIEYFIEFLAGIFPYKNKMLPKALSFLKKNLKRFPKLSSLEKFNVERDIPIEIKNKRLWQLTPLEIWELFTRFVYD